MGLPWGAALLEDENARVRIEAMCALSASIRHGLGDRMFAEHMPSHFQHRYDLLLAKLKVFIGWSLFVFVLLLPSSLTPTQEQFSHPHTHKRYSRMGRGLGRTPLLKSARARSRLCVFSWIRCRGVRVWAPPPFRLSACNSCKRHRGVGQNAVGNPALQLCGRSQPTSWVATTRRH